MSGSLFLRHSVEQKRGDTSQHNNDLACLPLALISAEEVVIERLVVKVRRHFCQ